MPSATFHRQVHQPGAAVVLSMVILSVMTLRASVATCPAQARSLLVTASPRVIGWHTFSASVCFFTHKHIFFFISFLGCGYSSTWEDSSCNRVIYTSHVPTFLHRALSPFPRLVQQWKCRVLTLKPWIPVGTITVPFFPGDVFPSTAESRNRIFLLLPAHGRRSLAHEFCKHQAVLCLLLLWSVCCVKARPSETFGFHELLIPLAPKKACGRQKKRQSHDASGYLRLLHPSVSQGHLLWPQVSLLVSQLVQVIAWLKKKCKFLFQTDIEW